MVQYYLCLILVSMGICPPDLWLKVTRKLNNERIDYMRRAKVARKHGLHSTSETLREYAKARHTKLNRLGGSKAFN